MSYWFKKLLLRAVIGFPAPKWFNRLVRFYAHTKVGENFGDMTINGEKRFLDSHAQKCQVLFDIGAHTGSWTKLALKANPLAQIHCFEPIDKHYKLLINQAFPDNVKCNKLGLSDISKRVKIFTDTMSLYQRDQQQFGSETSDQSELVDLVTVDQYCLANKISKIDLLKIDAEGHDFFILKGCNTMIEQEMIMRFQFEYGPYNIYSRTLLKDFYTLFEGRPYTFFQILPDGLNKVHNYDFQLENFVYKNFAVLHHSVLAITP